jgi:hypothetical protein
VLGKKQSIVLAKARRTKVEIRNELRRGFFALRPQFVRDLFLPTLFLKKLLLRFRRTTFRFRCPVRVSEDRIDDRGSLNQQLLIQ